MSAGPSSRSRRRTLRLAVQVLGFLIGLGVLGWCAAEALSGKNAAQLDRLGDASPGQIAALIALSGGSLLLNGLIFWALLLPVRRLRVADTLATNALATFLNYLPFKLSAISRVVIHNRRDRVPLLIIGAWFVGIGVTVLTSLGPLLAVSLWRERIDAVWLGTAALGVLAAFGATVLVARTLAGERGLARLHRLIDPLAPAQLQRWLRSDLFVRLHAGLGILASPAGVGAATALRLADTGVQAARFVVAADVVGHELPYSQALLAAAAYFLVGILSPVGMLGLREGAATGLAGALAFTSGESFAVITLLVSATESIVNLAGAAIGLAWLRPDRLLRLRGERRPI